MARVRITLVMDTDLLYRITDISERTGRSMDALLRKFIEHGARREEEYLGDPRPPRLEDYPTEETYFVGDEPRKRKRA